MTAFLIAFPRPAHGLAASLLVAACSSEAATRDQCRMIFDRMVLLELREMGFADPALAARRQTELAQRYGKELDACVGQPLAPGALRCVSDASTAEEISHRCLR
jgi:hypothetical protein